MWAAEMVVNVFVWRDYAIANCHAWMEAMLLVCLTKDDGDKGSRIKLGVGVQC